MSALVTEGAFDSVRALIVILLLLTMKMEFARGTRAACARVEPSAEGKRKKQLTAGT
jgi:hypothetical protein